MKYIARIKVIVFLLCLIPLGRLGWLAYTDDLGANPIEFITHSTGTWTLVFLLITLGVTPLRALFGLQWLIRYRRMLGLFAFFYVCLHFTTYIWLDQFFDMQEIIKDVIKRPFITAGFTSFVLLIPLALTSTRGMIARLGGKRWQRLHRLIYLSAIGGVIHYFWLVKADLRLPLIYGAVLSLLLGYRMVVKTGVFKLKPTFFRSGSGREPYSRGLACTDTQTGNGTLP
jgi:sulfoxide reductase heme-binding subunit YedZ